MLDAGCRRLAQCVVMAKVAKQPKKQPPVSTPVEPKVRWQIESPTRGIYVGSRYAERARNWPIFTHLSSTEAAIIRFDDLEAAEAELVYVRSYAANARLREVE